MTPAEIRAEAEKACLEYAGAKGWSSAPMREDAFLAGYLAGARKMNEECAARLDEGTEFEWADEIRSLLPQGEVKG